jgi:hypothetical protein
MEVLIMSMLKLVGTTDLHQLVDGFDIVAGVIGLIVLLWIVVEMILMVPDLIRTIKIHKM